MTTVMESHLTEWGEPLTAQTVVLVDDHELLAETVSLALARAAIDCVAVNPCEPSALLADLLDIAPAAVLLDLDLGPFGDSTSLIAPLTEAGIRVVVLTGQTDRIALALALEQGAVCIQPKTAGFDELIATARAAATGEAVHAADAVELRLELAAHRRRTAVALKPFRPLTEREQGTLRQLADGHTVQDIAQLWVVSQATVRSHVQAVLHKLGVSSQLEAVAAARTSGWLDHTTE